MAALLPRRSPGPWLGNDRERSRFEWPARIAFPGMRASDGPGRRYALDIQVPFYEEVRHVTIEFPTRSAVVPTIRADGPTESPHRYPDGAICIWYPWDPSAERWVVTDGLLHLIRLVEVHLFREAWWREHHEWLGPEAPHGDPKRSEP